MPLRPENRNRGLGRRTLAEVEYARGLPAQPAASSTAQGLASIPPRSAPIEERPFTLITNKPQILSTAKDRRYLLIQNNSINVMFLSFGKDASAGGVQIPAGGNYEPFIPTNKSISGFGNGNGVIVEG